MEKIPINRQNIGYITASFSTEEKEAIINWSKIIENKDLYLTEKNGEVEGGNVTNKLHLTLFYGFDEDRLDKSYIEKIKKETDLKIIEIGGLGVFSLLEQDYKVVYLAVKDQDGALRKYHEEFKKLPHFEEYQKFEFTSHIAIAFVKKEFDETGISYRGPQFLHIEKIIYHSKK